MKRTLISARSVVYFIMIQALFLLICCKGRSGGGNLDTTDVISDKKAETQTQQNQVLITDVACGCHTTLILRADGTVWAWGRNSFGTLGNGKETDSHAPVLVAGLNDVVAISSACEYSIALRSDGTVWTWGSNEYGGLGNDSKINSNIPVQVKGLTGIKMISGGSDHALALKNDGTVWTWGNNSFGQMANGKKNNEFSKNDPENDQLVPAQVPDLYEVTEIAASRGHSMVLKADGTVWAWGRNDLGQLGDGTNREHFTPVQVSGPDSTGFLTDIISIAGGGSYGGNSAAIRSDGKLYIWGDNSRGQLGNGSVEETFFPSEVAGLKDIIAVNLGGEYVLALGSDGIVWAWGNNEDSQLGIISDTEFNRPVKIPGLSGIMSVYAGSSHNAALQKDGTLWLWGDDYYGQLGDGSAGHHLSGY